MWRDISLTSRALKVLEATLILSLILLSSDTSWAR